MKIIIESFLSDSLGPCTIGCADEFIQSVKKMTSDNDENNYMYWYPPTTNQASQVVRSDCKQYGGNVNIIVAAEEDPFNFTSEIKNWHSSFSIFSSTGTGGLACVSRSTTRSKRACVGLHVP